MLNLRDGNQKKRKKKKTGVRNERGRVKDGGERRIWSAAEAELYSRARALRIDEEELREDIIINSRAGKTRSSITARHIRRARAQIFILLVTDLPRSTRRERRLGGRDSGAWDDVEHSNSPHGLISHNILCKVKGNEREKSTTRPEVLFSHVHHSLSRHYSSKTQWSVMCRYRCLKSQKTGRHTHTRLKWTNIFPLLIAFNGFWRYNELHLKKSGRSGTGCLCFVLAVVSFVLQELIGGWLSG